MKYFIILFSFLFVHNLFSQAPVGNQFQINTNTNLAQRAVNVAMNDAGNAVAVWQSIHTNDINIYAKRFDANGDSVGTEFLVNTRIALEQSAPAVAIDSLGNFVITWNSTSDSGDVDVYAQLYDFNGDKVGGEFRVNTDTVNLQNNPVVAMDRDGGFVIAWQNYATTSISIAMQRYDSDGNPLGSQTQVNDYDNRDNTAPEIAMNPSGDFVLAWQANYTDPDVSARFFNASGTPVANQIVVNQYTTNNQLDANVDIDKDGNFIVVWRSLGQDGSSYGVYGRRYDNTMTAQTNEFLLNTTTDSAQVHPDVVLDNNGEFTAFWAGIDPNTSFYNVYYKRFDINDEVLMDETLLSTETNGNQLNPDVATNKYGNFFASWEDGSGLDGLGYGVFGRLFKKAAPVISNIPNQSIEEGSSFTVIDLDSYVVDNDDADSTLVWTYSGNTELSVVIDGNRSATVTAPDADWFGSEDITFTATDDDGLSDDETVTFEITNVNDAPVVSNIPAQTISEGGTFATVNLDNYVADIDDADSLIVWSYFGASELSVDITNRVATISAPDTNWYGAENITFVATDAGGLADSNAALFTVNAVNDAPVVTTIPDQTITEGNTFTTITLDNFVSDVDNADDELTWSTSGESELSVSIVNRVATITIPDINWYGSETITFTATDPGNLFDNTDVQFTVTNINDAPVVSDIGDVSINEGQSFSTIDLDDYVNDVDNTDSQISWNYSGNTNLSIDINETTHIATITTPGVDWYGEETITFTATDPGNLSDSDPATFTVTAVNDAPVVLDISDQSIDEGFAFETITLDNFVSDVDNNDNEMTWSYSGNSELTVSISAGRIATVSIPDVNWNGSETITFKATDPGGLADSADVIFTVNPVNDSPVVANIPDQDIQEGETFATIALDDFVSDPDNADSEINWIYSGNSELTVSISPARVATITIPNVNWNGEETITFEASDPGGRSDSDPATFTVNAVNDAPVVSGIPNRSIVEGGTFNTVNLSNYVSDVDNSKNEMTWSYSGNSELTVSITDSIATITTPGVNWNGAETITFTATDPGGLSDSDDAVFTVSSENDPPIVSDIGDQTIEEGETFATISLDDFVADADNADNQITWTYSGNKDLAVSIDGSRIATISVPNENWNGSETITFTAEDPDGLSNSDDAVFTVTAVNDAPVVSDIPAQNIAEGDAFTNIALDSYVSDVDDADNMIIWSFSGNTELSVSINEETRVATVTAPSAEWSGSEIITFTATDPGDLFDSDTVAFTITAVNDAPVVSDIANQTVDEGSTFTTITLDDFVDDIDNEDSELTWEASGASELVVSIDENRVATISIPSEDWNGSETITFTATDPGELSDSDTTRFTVNAVNDAPVVSEIADQTIKEGSNFSNINLDSFVSDVDNIDSEITWTFSGNSHLILQVDTSRVLHVMPENPDWFGTDTVYLTATDPGALAAHDTVAFTATPVNDAPVIGDLPGEITFTNDSTVTIPLEGRASDVDSPIESLIWSFEVSNDSLLYDYDEEMQTVTFSVLGNFVGDVEIYGTVTDDSMASDTDTILVHIDVINAIDDMFSNIPAKYELHQNFPNPFNPATKIRFGLPKAGHLKLEIYNIIGQKVATVFDGVKTAGYHLVEFDGSQLASGIYFYRIQAGKFVQIRKMVLIK